MIIGVDRTGSCPLLGSFSVLCPENVTPTSRIIKARQDMHLSFLTLLVYSCIPYILFMNALHLPCAPSPPPHTLSYYFPHVLSISSITLDLLFLFSISQDGVPGGVCGQRSPHVSIFRTKHSHDVSSSDAVGVPVWDYPQIIKEPPPRC